MLAGEAARLAAIEVLCPTAALMANSGFPTLAGWNVFDSRYVSLQDLDRTSAFTPTLGLFTNESAESLRGDASDADDKAATTVLDIVAELAVAGVDGEGEFADAVATDDPQARLVIAALAAQVNYLLEYSQAGYIWRRVVKRVARTEYLTFAVPELGIRYQRITIRKHLEISADDFGVEVGALPEPLGSLYAALPAGSYAKAKLAELAAHFSPDLLAPLEAIAVTTGPVVSGPDFT